MTKTKPSTRNIALIFLFIYVVFMWMFLPLDSRELRMREGISHVFADQRNLSLGLEAYMTEYAEFPTERPFIEYTSRRDLESAGGTELSGIAPATGITAGLADPFAPGRLPYAYFRYPATGSTPAGWIVFSTGPDRKYELTRADYTPGTSRTLAIIGKTYDPTNGTTSTGDVWRSGHVVATTSPATALLPPNESPSPIPAQNN